MTQYAKVILLVKCWLVQLVSIWNCQKIVLFVQCLNWSTLLFTLSIFPLAVPIFPPVEKSNKYWFFLSDAFLSTFCSHIIVMVTTGKSSKSTHRANSRLPVMRFHCFFGLLSHIFGNPRLTTKYFSNIEKLWCQIGRVNRSMFFQEFLFLLFSKIVNSLNMWDYLQVFVLLRGKSLSVKNPTNFLGRGSFTNCNCFNNLQGNNSNSAKGN